MISFTKAYKWHSIIFEISLLWAHRNLTNWYILHGIWEDPFNQLKRVIHHLHSKQCQILSHDNRLSPITKITNNFVFFYCTPSTFATANITNSTNLIYEYVNWCNRHVFIRHTHTHPTKKYEESNKHFQIVVWIFNILTIIESVCASIQLLL